MILLPQKSLQNYQPFHCDKAQLQVHINFYIKVQNSFFSLQISTQKIQAVFGLQFKGHVIAK